MKNIEQLAINTIRMLSVEAVQKANSGHPGLPLGAAPMAYALWARIMKHNPQNPGWENRDRFVLSAGHGSMLLYSLLHLFGYGLSLEDLKNFRQYGSKTPGHPEYGHTAGIETTTGPLGQGIANGVGMAMAEKHLAARFNKEDLCLVDHFTYVIAGDGCMMEGISGEAASLAGTLELGKLIVLYDSNNITIEGSTDIAFRENVGKRFEAYGWQVLTVDDGNDIDAVETAVLEGKAETKRPTLVEVKTQIGYGCPPKQGKASAHGEPLGERNIQETKAFLDWQEGPFGVPSIVEAYLEGMREELSQSQDSWNELLKRYEDRHPEDWKAWKLWNSGRVEEDLLEWEEYWRFESKKAATRQNSEVVINRLSPKAPFLVGGSADLAPSTKTIMHERGDFSAENPSGSNLHFGVREHAMAAILNGMQVHGGLRTYGATFAVFSDYMKGAMRMSAIMKLPVTYVLTHDSIGVGEDGPTHQPVEQLASLRSMPNMTVFRPADGKETAAAWCHAVTKDAGPTAIVLTRQSLPQYAETGRNALKGGYILLDSKKEPEIILLASGSEVECVYEAAKLLQADGIGARAVSMPSFELFDLQPLEYQESVLPKKVTKRLAVEAASGFGWHKYLGLDGATITMDRFGECGKAEELFELFGFTAENVVKRARDLLAV
nr:transketolase [Anaerotalea alkaliphila]